MAYFPSYKIVIIFPIFLLLVFLTTSSAWDLCPDYYSDSCPGLSEIVRNIVEAAIGNETRNGASLLRLHFHDCFVNGCDASILLDDTHSSMGEKTASQSNNSLRGYEIIDQIKEEVEKVCPRVVSCADILAIAASDSVNILGGPTWDVPLGRKDSRTASFAAANASIPSPSSNINELISVFEKNGLSKQDLVALSGAHTIGFAQCATARFHIYKETGEMNLTFAEDAQARCPPKFVGDRLLLALDSGSGITFDNNIYVNIIKKSVLLHSEQQLTYDTSTNVFVQKYIEYPDKFNEDFAEAMIKMGNIQPAKRSKLEIRKDCRKVNKKK